MKGKGYITKIIAHQRFYEISSISEQKYVLFFEELGRMRFIMGDELEFDVVSTESYGLCALNPVKKTNLYFEELKVHSQNQSTFVAYVYNRNSSGFEVSYKGYRCFCPYYEMAIEEYIEDKEIIDTYQKFNVLSIEGTNVILSKKKIVKNELIELSNEEINNLQIGFKFKGKVKRVVGFGIFITYCYSSGLLHYSKFTNFYNNELDKNTLRKFQKTLSGIFTKGRDIEVIVDNINGNQLSLILNHEDQNNSDLLHELVENCII